MYEEREVDTLMLVTPQSRTVSICTIFCDIKKVHFSRTVNWVSYDSWKTQQVGFCNEEGLCSLRGRK